MLQTPPKKKTYMDYIINMDCCMSKAFSKLVLCFIDNKATTYFIILVLTQ